MSLIKLFYIHSVEKGTSIRHGDKQKDDKRDGEGMNGYPDAAFQGVDKVFFFAVLLPPTG